MNARVVIVTPAPRDDALRDGVRTELARLAGVEDLAEIPVAVYHLMPPVGVPLANVSLDERRKVARGCLTAMRGRFGDELPRLLMCGNAVAAAFGHDRPNFRWWPLTAHFQDETNLRTLAARIPNPMPGNPWYRDPRHWSRASEFMRDLIARYEEDG